MQKCEAVDLQFARDKTEQDAMLQLTSRFTH